MNDKREKFELSELHLVKADADRTYIGSLKRNKETNALFGTVTVEEGKIISIASSDDELTKNMDDICKLKLDHRIHQVSGRQIKVMEGSLFYN